MKLRLPIVVVMLFLLILILPFFVSQVESGTSTNTLYAHAETTTIGGVNYYLHKLSSADGPATTLSQSAASTGRKLMGRWVYPLSGIVSISASTWTVTFRAMKSSSASSVVAHGDIDLLIRKSDNTIRTTLATDVANSPTLTLTNTWQTLTGTFNWPGYTVVNQTDYLEVAYYIEVTTLQNSKYVRLMVDDNTLALADQTKIENVMFTYLNQAPVLNPIGPKSVNELQLLTFTATASDPDLDPLTFSLGAGAPTGASITSTGIFTWTPTESQGSGVYVIRVIVSDGSLTDYEDVSVTVNEVNVAPVLNPIGAKSVNELELLTFTATASDADIPAQTLTFSLGPGAPAGASINSASGVFTWIPTEAQGPGVYTIRIIVSDGSLTDFEDVSVTVNEVNVAPILNPIGPKSVNELELLTFTATATDSDVPIQTLTFSLGAGAPAGASITSAGVFTWTPTEAQGPGVYSIRIIVSDGIAQDYEDITVTVYEVYVAPIASFTYSPSNPLIYDTVTFDASASYDPDGSIVSYMWNFGDGNVTTVTSPVITHVYTTAASTVNYTVTLTVTDNGGLTGVTTKIVPVTNPSILHVSLPAGTYVGPDPDNWLSQCWLLNITELSGTFTVRINNTHASYVSYNTHLIIALNNGAYNYLSSLTVDSTTIPPSSFTYGKPQPYGFTLTWENDVYPTWFSDIYVVGDINPKSYKDVTVSVTFSNTTGVRMHFDAYGSADPFPPPPTSKGHVTDNPHEKDSTVLFSLPAVVQYYLTVTSPYGTVGGQGWYISGGIAYATLNTSIVDYGNGTRRVFLNWSGDASGTNYAQSNPILMDSNKTAIAVWKTQYQVSFTQTGSGVAPTVTYTADTDPTGTVPFGVWVKAGSEITYAYQDPVLGAPGVRYVLISVTPLSPQTVNSPLTISGSYKTQYQITVTASPSEALGGTFKVTYTQCGTTYTNVQKATSWTEWVDGTTTVTVSEPQDIVNGYKFDSYNPSATVTMDQAKTITLVYKAIQPFSVSISPTSAKIKVGESVTFTSTVSGGVPGYSYQWYLNGTAVSGAISPTWTFTPATSGTYNVYLNVTDSIYKTAKSNVASVTVAPPLTVSISPTSASILVGQSVTFTSTPSGGYPPYSYQWYLDGVQVSGATSASWTFTPTTSGIYYVYLQVKDANNNIAQSETAKITVIPSVPVGGYSISLAKRTPTSQIAAYTLLIALFGVALSFRKRKRK